MTYSKGILGVGASDSALKPPTFLGGPHWRWPLKLLGLCLSIRTERKLSGTFPKGEIWHENSITVPRDFTESWDSEVGFQSWLESRADFTEPGKRHFSELSNFLERDFQKAKEPKETIWEIWIYLDWIRIYRWGMEWIISEFLFMCSDFAEIFRLHNQLEVAGEEPASWLNDCNKHSSFIFVEI